MIREKWYELKNWRGVVHTTWNPKGPGVLRIHLVPPSFSMRRTPPALAILNGQFYVPVNEAWAILLTEFIRYINNFGDGPMGKEDLQKIWKRTCRGVHGVYPFVPESKLREDLLLILEVFEDIARGKKPQIEIGQLSLGEYAPYMTAPHRMDLMVSAMERNGSWNCNQKCLHCYAAGQTYAAVEELPTEDWKKIIANCKKAGIPQLTFTGGEPTLRKDLCELVKAARWFVTRLNTNGILLTEELCRDLYLSELDSVQITFYSCDEKVHNRLVGGNHFKETVRGIQNALAAKLSVSINTPLCMENRNYADTLSFLHELGVSYVTCSGLIVTGNAQKEASKRTELPREDLLEILKDAVAFCYENEMEISFTSPGFLAQEELQELGLVPPSCGACLSNMAVTPDGRAVPCQSFLSAETLGDMRVDSFRKIWNHPMCRERRSFSAEMRRVCPLREEGEET